VKTILLWCAGTAAICVCVSTSPNILLSEGDRAVQIAPTASFAQEIKHLNQHQTPYKYVAPLPDGDSSTEADLADLRAALELRGVKAATIAQICRAHANERAKLGAPESDIEVIEEVPTEFAIYFRGFISWRRAGRENEDESQKRVAKAVASWSKVLELPPAERQFKSTWASYMLGVAEGDDEKAIAHFRRVRTLVDQGFADSQGLAAASTGLEAQIYLAQREYVLAIEYYLLQDATGDPTALDSLRIVATEAFKPDNAEQLKLLASDPAGRRVLTAYLASGHANDSDDATERWLHLLESANVRDADLAQQLGLAAYQAGKMDGAKHWLKQADPNAFAVRWLKAKLLFHDGELDRASETLAELAGDFPINTQADEPDSNLSIMTGDDSPIPARAQVLAELGVLRLARREYPEALDALLRAGFWLDAAYLAERVLTIPELVGYVDLNWPTRDPNLALPKANDWSHSTDPDTLRVNIRYLLARRLARCGEEQKARAYFPVNWRERFDQYLALLAGSDDQTKPPRERSDKLWEAARILREDGLDLCGTETTPDWNVYGGSFSDGVDVKVRSALFGEQLSPTAEEIARAHEHQPNPDRRFHYRYTAAQLALRAAKLLPDNDPATAIILCTAGSWLKDRDPKAADPFYKTLVRRCRKTEIGKEADKIRWFPRIDENGKLIPKPGPAPAPAPNLLPPELLQEFPLAFDARFLLRYCSVCRSETVTLFR
jgi:hypothetical protein